MSKRLVGLLLLLAMLVTMVLTSCSSDDDYEEDESTIKPITLTFYGLMEEGTTLEAVEAVEAEINKYTQKNYKTTIDLVFCYEDKGYTYVKTDANGNPVYGHAYLEQKDANGNVIVNENGMPQYVQQVDENGDPLFDDYGDPVYEYEYVEKVDENGNTVLDKNGDPVMEIAVKPVIVEVRPYDEQMDWSFERIEIQKLKAEAAEDAASKQAKIAREYAKLMTTEEQKEKKRAQRNYEKWAAKNPVEEKVLESSDDVVVDIFLMRGFDNYQVAAENDRLADLASYANGTYKLIYKYTSSIVLQSARMNGMLFGVPTNKLLETSENEAYYYAIKTDLLDKYNIKIEDGTVPGLDSVFGEFFAKVKENENCEVMLAPPPAIQNFDFYLDDMDNYPIFGTRSNESTTTNSSSIEFTYKVLDPNDLTAGVANSHYKKMAAYRTAGYFAPDGSTVEDTDFAVGFFRGTLDGVKEQLGDKADDYSYYIYKCSRITNDIVFENLLSVSAECKYPDRAFQVIAGLHTVEELRNLLTFGIKDVNYTVNEDGETVKMLNNEYNIDFERYGNSLIGYTPEELGFDYQLNAAKKNSEVKVSAYLGYVPGLEPADEDALAKVSEVAREYQATLMGGYAEDVDAYYNEAMIAMGKESNVLGVYPDVKEDPEDFEPSYALVREALSSDYGSYASGGRPLDRQSPNNEFLSKEETDRRNAIEREKESIIIKAKEVLPEGETIIQSDKNVIIENVVVETEVDGEIVKTESKAVVDVVEVIYDVAFRKFVVADTKKDISLTAKNTAYVVRDTNDIEYVVGDLVGFLYISGNNKGNPYITRDLKDLDEDACRYLVELRQGDIINSNAEIVKNILDDALAAGEIFDGEISINLEDIGIIPPVVEEEAA